MKFVSCNNCKKRVPDINFCEYCRGPLREFKCECGNDLVKPAEMKIIPFEAKPELFILIIEKVLMVCTKCFKEYEFSKDDFDFKKLKNVYFSKRAEREAIKYANICRYCDNCETFHFTEKCGIEDKKTSPIKNAYIMNIDKLFNVENKEYKPSSGTFWFDDLVEGGLPDQSSTLYYTDLGPEKFLFEIQFIKEGLKNGEAVLVVLDSDPNEFRKRLEKKLAIKVEKYIKMETLMIIDLYSCEELDLPPSYDQEGIIRSAKDLTSVAIAITRALNKLKKRTCKRALINIISYVLRVSKKHIIEFTRDTINKLKKEHFTTLLTTEKKLIDEKRRSELSEIMDNIIESDATKKEINDKLIVKKRLGILVMKDITPDQEYHPIKITKEKMFIS